MTTASASAPLSDSELRKAAAILEALRRHQILSFKPNRKQLEFYALGKHKRERMLMAPNQCGKTLGAGNEVSWHLTGRYPHWWDGRRFTQATKWWVACTTNETTRDNPQRVLLGSDVNKELGTGTIPASAIADKPTMSRGFPGLVDKVYVDHISGGVSMVQFKAYEQGRARWQGATLDGIWYDEEPPEDVYSEGLARITATGGFTMITSTPLLGMSEVVSKFYPEPDIESRGLVEMDISDATHFDESEREIIISAYKPHEREARAHGRPMMGEGLVFQIPQSSFTQEPFPIPDYFARLGAMDFGWGDHPFAAVLLAWDRDSDVVYVTSEYKEVEPSPAIHASAIRPWTRDIGEVPYVWPHDGHKQWGDSGPIKNLYKNEGVKMWREHATFKEGGYSTEAGVEVIRQRMMTGRFKVFSHMTGLLAEISTYHRKDGQIVRKKDDLLSAVRQGMMMLRYARTPVRAPMFESTVASEYDPFAMEHS